MEFSRGVLTERVPGLLPEALLPRLSMLNLSPFGGVEGALSSDY